ncbi:MAG: hypothetical protein JWN34_5485 [Bryobacterales bacterium]|nr:hypothetical protein [Bryobacterales bacterium]
MFPCRKLKPMSEVRVAAGDAAFDEKIRGMAESVQSRLRYHSIELRDGSVLPGLQSIEHLRGRLAMFGLPDDLTGKRVLDIGAWDGWFSFECERRGASVVAVDCVELDTFLEAKALLNSQVEYLTLDVAELSSAKLGTFDIVLFFGVLYHLRHPLLGLERVLELTTDIALIESFVIASEARAIPAVMEFYERAELGGQIDNWCGPSPECLISMCRSAGFAQVYLLDVTSQRASVICHRHWRPVPSSPGPAPLLVSAVNSRTYLPRFHQFKDEYICCFFKSAEPAIAAEDMRIEVDGFGVPAILAAPNGPGAWQANCLRPVGLKPGRHHVTVRTAGSARSNTAEFIVADPDGAAGPEPSTENFPAPELCSIEHQPSSDRRITLGREGTLVIYFRSTVTALGSTDIALDVGGHTLPAHTISFLGDGIWQANRLLEQALADDVDVRIRLGGGAWSQPQKIRRA